MTLWHPFTQHGIAGPMVEIERAEGAYLYAKDGRRILDAISSWWVNTHGHCHPRIVQAVQAQAAKLEQVIFAGFTHEPAERLAAKLLKMANGALSPLIPLPSAYAKATADEEGRGRFSYVFLSDSGSTAVEVALKMAIGYWKHIGSPRSKIVALEGGYHGDTFGAMSAGGRSVYNDLYEPYLFDVAHLPFDDMVGGFEKMLREDGGDIAALIVEPLVQGAAGMRMYPSDDLKKLADLCAQHDVLLIADEVMTGFGRTGTMFACEQAGVQPDIMCLSKGLTGGFLPMGATLCAGKIYDAFYSKDRSKMFFHSSSYTGNALACAAALASLEIWEAEPVRERIAAISKAHEIAAAKLAARPDVANVREAGTILAFDVIPAKAGIHEATGNKIANFEQTDTWMPAFAGMTLEGYLAPVGPLLYELFMAQDILLRPIGNTVYILPPYCMKTEELERIYDAISRALDALRDEGQQRAA